MDHNQPSQPASPATTAPKPATAPAADDRPSRTITGPPPRAGRTGTWLLLLLCLIVAAPALLIDLNRPDAIDPAETKTLATASHTRMHQAELPDSVGWSGERLTPTLNHQPQLQTPPGVTWLQLAAVVDLGRDDLDTDDLVLRGRLVSVAFALVTIAAVFWAGLSIAGLPTAAFAALVCAANVVFIHHARLASGAVVQVALTTLSIAAALWAIRPLRPSASILRQGIGWGVCGLALGAAMLAAGPVAAPAVALPIFLMLMLGPQRLSRLLGLTAALAISVLVIVPWVAYVHDHDPDVYRLWLTRINPLSAPPATLAATAAQRTALGLLALLPWTLWLIGAIAQPFSASSKGSRRRLFLGWLWFAAATLMVLIVPAADHDRRAAFAQCLWVVPAAAVFIGQLFAQYADLAGEGRFPRLWRLLRWPHMALLLVASVVVLVAPNLQTVLIEHGLIADPIVSTWRPWFWISLSAVLLCLVVLGLRWAMQQYPGRTLVCWAAWAIVLGAIIAFPLSLSESQQSPLREVAKRFEQISADTPAFWLQADGHAPDPDPALLLYAGRALPPITSDQLGAAAKQHQLIYVVGPADVSPPVTGLVPTPPLEGLDIRIWRLAPS
ncbi:MAG: hypothetical protein V3U29_10735 [Phycisphaeraceae bacterium]